jgi:hypothetical protein
MRSAQLARPSATPRNPAPFAALTLFVERGPGQQWLTGMFLRAMLGVTLIGIIARRSTQPAPDVPGVDQVVSLDT